MANGLWTISCTSERQERPHYLCPACSCSTSISPGLTGYQVLTQLHRHVRTRHLPVIILTTTDEPHDLERCEALGYRVSLTKPVAYEPFVNAIRTLSLFFSIVQVPHSV